MSQSRIDNAIRYIAQQPQHHEKTDFKTEFRRLLDKHGIAYDERYVWD